MNSKELRKLSKEELIQKKKELAREIMSSYTKVKPKIKPEQRKARRRLIARINTILQEEGVVFYPVEIIPNQSKKIARSTFKTETKGIQELR